MKLTAGFHNTEDYLECVRAGADELFCGYVPEKWYDTANGPLNRREVHYCDVQLGGENELRILAAMMKDTGVPVALTLNSPWYDPKQYPWLEDYIHRCMDLGFHRFIIADPGLLHYLSCQNGMKSLQIHVSGEYGEFNPSVIRRMDAIGVTRVIFQRHDTTQDMMLCTQTPCRNIREYEAFFLNEKCHYLGGLCSSLHCDELPPLCRVPYETGRIDGRKAELPQKRESAFPDSGIGASGCAMCSLWRYRDSGITHLKIVGRGNYTERILRDIAAARQALKILEDSREESEYLKEMKARFFAEGCSGNCYGK